MILNSCYLSTILRVVWVLAIDSIIYRKNNLVLDIAVIIIVIIIITTTTTTTTTKIIIIIICVSIGCIKTSKIKQILQITWQAKRIAE